MENSKPKKRTPIPQWRQRGFRSWAPLAFHTLEPQEGRKLPRVWMSMAGMGSASPDWARVLGRWEKCGKELGTCQPRKKNK